MMEFPSRGVPGSAIVQESLGAESSMNAHLSFLHDRLSVVAPFVERIAVALYDPETDALKTFINSTRSGYAIRGYEYPLSNSASLSSLVANRETRVIDDIPQALVDASAHSNYIVDEGYLSSFTVPLFHQGTFLGIAFFDARERNAFGPALQQELVLYAQLIAVALSSQLLAIKSIVGTVQVARDLTELRDIETGAHLERMARYAQLVAHNLVEPLNLTDEFVESVYLYAPLHDIGKIGVPDHVLLKPGRLNEAEWVEMKAHTTKGRRMIDMIVEDLGAESISRRDILTNVVELHHEQLDGSGYPHGLEGEQIPLEARIVAVADIFDALTSSRPYKVGWPVDDAVAELLRMSEQGKLDDDCVGALVGSIGQVREIRARHEEIEEAIRARVLGEDSGR